MKAMILAAGLGTRLRPLTNTTPKALVNVHGLPILEIIIRQLSYYGFKKIIINLHYLSEKITDYIENRKFPGTDIYFSHEKEEILDTGGGIKRAREFLDNGDPFIVHNVDVLSDINLYEMYQYHLLRKALVTLAVKEKNSSRSLLFDKNWILSGWENKDTGESNILKNTGSGDLQRIGFCGIHVISPAIFDLMQKEKVFSIINTYIQLAMDHMITGYPVEQNLWMDIGSHEQLELVHQIDPKKYLPDLE